jgi:transposase-like protein
MIRVPASAKTRNALKDMLAGKSVADKSSFGRQAARLIVEEALESEAADAVGRGYYERGANARG